MVYMPQEVLLPKAENNAYKLIILASRRALELANNSPKLIEASNNEKLVTTALREIFMGRVVLKGVADEYAPVSKK